MQNPGVVMRRRPRRGPGCRWPPFPGTTRRTSPQGAVERAGADLHQPVGAELRPLHLLLLGEAFVDHDVDRGFHEGGRDWLAVAPAFAVVRDDGAVVADVAGELGGGFGEARPVGV